MDALGNLAKDYNNTITTLRDRMRDEGRIVLSSALSELFSQNPQLSALSWYQYTPYWNDGEPCEFRVNEVYFVTTNVDTNSALGSRRLYDSEYWEPTGYWSGSALPDPYPELRSIMKEFEKTLKSIEDVLLLVFGDHKQILAKRDGSVAVTHFEHD